ncbi:MAG: zinc-binding dehydrogenase [Myxococcales bacterium]|nr:zinc-binding dehydrogenase [Myxococcales bacterium]MCB9707419.1 zinc-binding dehydrogenase [Myxococcales bacterium]
MRAVWITRYGPPEVLEVRESPDPCPREHQVRIRVRAAGLNFAEIMARQGLYPDAPKPPCVVGYEVSGEVDARGAGAGDFQEGDRVVAFTHFGGHADTVVVPQDQVRAIPHMMSFEMAAALPVNYITAQHMIYRIACVRPGESVLVHMAAGGVGTAALQLMRSISGLTIFGTASEAKHDYVRAQGCTHPIDYRHADYFKQVLELTRGRGVDVVLDPLGGRDWKKGYQLLAPGGRLIAFGFANMAKGSQRRVYHVMRQWLSVPRFSPLKLMDDNRSIAGVNMGHLWESKDTLSGQVDELISLYAAGRIEPRIDSTFRFEDAVLSHRRMESRNSMGKILLVP